MSFLKIGLIGELENVIGAALGLTGSEMAIIEQLGPEAIPLMGINLRGASDTARGIRNIQRKLGGSDKTTKKMSDFSPDAQRAIIRGSQIIRGHLADAEEAHAIREEMRARAVREGIRQRKGARGAGDGGDEKEPEFVDVELGETEPLLESKTPTGESKTPTGESEEEDQPKGLTSGEKALSGAAAATAIGAEIIRGLSRGGPLGGGSLGDGGDDNDPPKRKDTSIKDPRKRINKRRVGRGMTTIPLIIQPRIPSTLTQDNVYLARFAEANALANMGRY